jgi:hypothetical protein
MRGHRAIACFGGFVTLTVLSTAAAQGPDEKGATLRFPGATPALGSVPATPAPSTPAPVAMPRPTSAPTTMPDSVKRFFPDLAGHDGEAVPRRTLADLQEKPDINQDLQVTEAAGAWMIFLIGYTGENGPMQARKMVSEIRSNPAYRIPAYVFYYGADERRKENERVKKLIEEQIDFYKKNKLMPDDGVTIRHRSIDVQYAVLIGGYPDADAAKAALAKVRKLPPPSPAKVDLEIHFTALDKGDGKLDTSGGKLQNGEMHYVSPFVRAFVCRNPMVKAQTVAKEDEKVDMGALRKWNSDEQFSLLKCPKAVTLAVKVFHTPFMMHDRNTSSTLWEKLSGSNANGVDITAANAHQLVQSLRNLGLEAYVLHTKFTSVVSIGGFNGPDDPALRSMQDLWSRKLREERFAYAQTQVQFLPNPVPMAIPK